MSAAVVMTISAAAQEPMLNAFNVGNDAYVNSLSRNGEWATYQHQADSGDLFEIQVINMTTGTFLTYTPQRWINYRGSEAEIEPGSFSRVTCISNDGKTIGGTYNGYPGYFTVDDLTWHTLTMGTTAMNRNCIGSVYAMSDDCSVMAGWFSEGTSMTTFYGGVWKDGELQTLNSLPTYADMYANGIISGETFNEEKANMPNYSFRALSADGTRMLMGVNHNYPGWGCSYGVYDLVNDSFEFILGPADMGYSFIDTATMSPSGKYVAGNIVFEEGELESVTGVYRYDIEKNYTEYYYEMADRDILVTVVDDNGVMFGATPAGMPTRNMVIRSESLWVDLAKILAQKYNMNFTNLTTFDTTGYAVGVATDGKTVVSQAEFRGGAFALRLPVTFDQAANGTSLLNEFASSPAPGSKFSRLTDIIIRFPYESEPQSQTAVMLTNAETGETVANSTAIESFSSQNILFTISFPETQLEEGKKYNVVIPANTFMVPGTSMGNLEITFSYEGRADVPVAPATIVPANESFVNELSSVNPITLTYDAQLTLSTAVQAQLFEEGNDVALSSMTASVAGNQLVIYPAVSRNLAKDKKYKVVLPAGLVADLGKSGKSEEYEIHYTGAFVPTPENKIGYLFYDDFDKPNTSMNNFLLYDGDKNMPNNDMAGIGFDEANTPWNFSVRDEGSYDYVAMSHSMYEPAGRSDDWMMIPQIELKGPDYYLTFKAQGYKQGANDVLKIKVWEYDDVISSLDDDIMAKVKSEAVDFQEITVVPSPTEGVLDGGWISYDFSLDRFQGKKIYIAFVNDNYNKSGIFINDLTVAYRGAYNLSVGTENNLVQAESTTVSGVIMANIDLNDVEFKATLFDGEGKLIDTIENESISIAQGDNYTFSFEAPLPLEKGVVNQYSVVTFVNNIEQEFKGNVSNHAFPINRRVLIEEGTGMWCGNCPLGEVAIENLEENFPDNVAIISVHNDDILAFSAYDQFLATGGYPMGRINRSEEVYAPMYSNAAVNDYTFTSPEGTETFMDIMLRDMNAGTEGEIAINDAVYFSADGVISLPVSVRFSIASSDNIYNIFTAILEDGLEGRQTNYFSNGNSQTMGWWNAQPNKVSYTYSNVVRDVIGSFYGESNRVPQVIEASKDYTTESRFALPATVSNPDNMHFVVALIDATTGRVVNSAVCKNFEVNPTPGASEDGVSTITIADAARMSVIGGQILVNGDADLDLYNLAGSRVANNGLGKGIYLVRKVMADGSVFTGRIMVR